MRSARMCMARLRQQSSLTQKIASSKTLNVDNDIGRFCVGKLDMCSVAKGFNGFDSKNLL